MGLNSRLIMDLSRVNKADKDLVGKKAHELGELWKLGIPIPEGFVITAEFFKKFLHITGISKEINEIKMINHPAIADSIGNLRHSIGKQILQQPIPQALIVQLHKFYRKFSGIFKEKSLNVSSSSINNKSIIFPNVEGDTNLILKIKEIWLMSFTEPVAIIVQENIKAGIKGMIFTNNPTVDKKLSKPQMDKLIGYCKIIQKHFYFPKQIEFTVNKGKIFITKVNPFTSIVREPLRLIMQNDKKQKVLFKGISINPGIVTGPVKILHNKYYDIKVKKGEVAVLPKLDPLLLKRIRAAKAIIFDSILPNSLSKTLYRKNFHVPTIEGVRGATKFFQNGNIVTVNGVSGEIYSGGLVY